MEEKPIWRSDKFNATESDEGIGTPLVSRLKEIEVFFKKCHT